MSAAEKFLEEFNKSREENYQDRPVIAISLQFYRAGKAYARYTDGEKDITVEVEGKAHAYKLAEKAQANAEEQGKQLTLEDGDGVNAPVFSDEAWNEFYHTFIPKNPKIWA